MKHTIIECDLCNRRICKNGLVLEGGAVRLRAKVLKEFTKWLADIPVTHSGWERITYYICPVCVEKIERICKGGKGDAKDT